jgi:hypothetical protein
MVRVPEIGYGWRVHPDQMTNQPSFQNGVGESILAVQTVARAWINWPLNAKSK